MIEAQLGRRNLTPDQRRLALGRRYNRLKGRVGPHFGDQQKTYRRTSERLAEEHGVGKNTVERAGKFATEVEASPELQKAIANKQSVRNAIMFFDKLTNE